MTNKPKGKKPKEGQESKRKVIFLPACKIHMSLPPSATIVMHPTKEDAIPWRQRSLTPRRNRVTYLTSTLGSSRNWGNGKKRAVGVGLRVQAIPARGKKIKKKSGGRWLGAFFRRRASTMSPNFGQPEPKPENLLR
ncbi:hypothetical protein L484_010688 [Morus notabilis]|uniref:Uncharacterized protein n=1 Tax=Morus notabilis TaxID=981085 RepID=W9SP13_9ROSA|nr:hypothetical protein L484_010688 [Morus notabilis]